MDKWSYADRACEKLLFRVGLVENAEPNVGRSGFLVWAVALDSCVSLIQMGNFVSVRSQVCTCDCHSLWFLKPCSYVYLVSDPYSKAPDQPCLSRATLVGQKYNLTVFTFESLCFPMLVHLANFDKD